MGRGPVRVWGSGVSDLREGRRAGRHPDPRDARCHSRCARARPAPGRVRFPRRDALAVRGAGARTDRRIHAADPGAGLRVGGVPGVRARRGARVQRMAARAGSGCRHPHSRSRCRRDRHVLHRRIRPRRGCRRHRARTRHGGARGAVPDQPHATRGSRCFACGADPGAGANPIRRPLRAGAAVQRGRDRAPRAIRDDLRGARGRLRGDRTELPPGQPRRFCEVGALGSDQRGAGGARESCAGRA